MFKRNNRELDEFLNKYYYSIVNRQDYVQLSFETLVWHCENILNSSFTRADFCKEQILAEANKKLDPISYYISVKESIDNLYQKKGEEIAYVEILNNDFPYIINSKFSFSTTPAWIESDKERFLLVYRAYLIEIWDRDILEILDNINYSNAISIWLKDERKKWYSRFKYVLKSNTTKASAGLRLIFSFNFLFSTLGITTVLNITTLITSIFFKNLYLVRVSQDGMKDISIGIVGALTAILGFSVLFLTIAFENLRKLFGLYARNLFFKLPQLKPTSILVLFTIICGILSPIFLLDFNYLSVALFNITVINFFLVIYCLIRNSKAMITNSSSILLLGKLISDINLDTFKNYLAKDNTDYTLTRLNQHFDRNEVYILNDIFTTNISQSNYRWVNLAIYELYDKTYDLIKYSSRDDLDKKSLEDSDLCKPLYNIINRSIHKFIKEDQTQMIESILDMCVDLNKISAYKKCSSAVINDNIKLLLRIISILEKNKQYELLEKALWTYNHLISAHIKYNHPNEIELSEFNKNIRDENRFMMEGYIKAKSINEHAEFRFSDVMSDITKNNEFKNSDLCWQILHYIIEDYKNSSIGEEQIFRIVSFLYFRLESVFKSWTIANPDKLITFPIASWEIGRELEKNKKYASRTWWSLAKCVKHVIIEHKDINTFSLDILTHVCREILEKHHFHDNGIEIFENIMSDIIDIIKEINMRVADKKRPLDYILNSFDNIIYMVNRNSKIDTYVRTHFKETCFEIAQYQQE